MRSRPDGTYIIHYAAMTYTDATTTANWPDRYVITQTDPTIATSGESAAEPDSAASPIGDHSVASSTES